MCQHVSVSQLQQHLGVCWSHMVIPATASGALATQDLVSTVEVVGTVGPSNMWSTSILVAQMHETPLLESIQINL